MSLSLLSCGQSKIIHFTDPTSLSNLVAWYDVNDVASMSITGSDVNSINDKSTIANHLSAVGVIRPTYSATSMGGLPGITFDGVNQVLFSISRPFTTVSSFTSFFVAKGTSSGNAYNTIYGLGPLGDDFDINMRQPSGSDIFPDFFTSGIGELQAPGLTVALNKIFISTMQRNEPAGKADIKIPTLIDTADSNIFSSGAITIQTGETYLGGYNSGNEGFPGVISEFILYNRLLSGAEYARVVGYLNSKWKVF